MGEMVSGAASAVGKSWRTSVPGWCAFGAEAVKALGALLDSDPTTNPDWLLVGTLLMVALGLSAARDHVVTSETAGAK